MLSPKGLSTVRIPLVCTTVLDGAPDPVVTVVDEGGGAAALAGE
jgi:hypothetical protein